MIDRSSFVSLSAEKSIEKTEENLATGQRTFFDSANQLGN